MTGCPRPRSIEVFATVVCTLVAVAATLTGCRDDLKEIVVIDNRSMRGQAVQSCSIVSALPVIEWDSELEFGCTDGMPCPLLAADSQSCADKSDRVRGSDLAHSIVTEAEHEPRCDGIVVVESTTSRSRAVRQSLQRPHWVLEIAYRSPEEGASWVLVRHEARMIRGYGQGTAPEIVRKMCALVRESTAPRTRAGNGPHP
jgi:hypothetical protein